MVLNANRNEREKEFKFYKKKKQNEIVWKQGYKLKYAYSNKHFISAQAIDLP